jgi:hypothetical protein
MLMKRLNLYLVLIAVVLIGLAALASSARAAPHAAYELVRSYTGPGGQGSAGIYDLSSSIGQPAAGEVRAGSYTFGGGFWGGGAIVPVQANYEVYLPLVLK